jgi:protease II
MESGHGGASVRYEQYRTDALEYAFVLDVLHGRTGSARGTRGVAD